jgi:hypothetical protein
VHQFDKHNSRGFLWHRVSAANMRSSIINAAAAAALAFSGLSAAANATEWQSRSIYQVMIDRFAQTDGSTAECDDLSKFCGGTWKGLMNNLDYIQGEQPPFPLGAPPVQFG